MTTETMIAEPRTRTARITAVQAGFLFAAPLVAIAARSLLTPWYQTDSDQPDNVRILDEIVGATVRNDVGAVLTLLSGILFACAALVIGGLVRSRRPWLGVVGQAMAFVGAFGLAELADQQAVFVQLARSDDRTAMIDLLEQVAKAPQSNVSFLLIVLGAVGWMLLGVGLYRGRRVPRAAAVLVGIGGAAVLLTAPGPAAVFILGGAVVATAGLGWVALSTRD
jgi:hypothetical protein